jgi:WD40-like Beta Propeller Repeat
MSAARLRTRSRSRRHAFAAVSVAVALVSATLVTAASASPAGSNPYFSAPFSVRTNPFTFGQDPSWTPDGRVLSNEPDRAGTEQVYVSRLDGSRRSCLTCGQQGPNGFPQERPQGDWILFCSWRGQPVTLGAPCLGGVGTDLYAMRPDGSHVIPLTSEAPGTVFDNYHPAWSPDGRQVVWTHVAFDPITTGGTQWTMLVADFIPNGDHPHLSNVVTVGPAENTGYETQVWAPDGSGFLYTAMGQNGSGWLNLELYFARVHGNGATAIHPQVVHLTDNNTGWDEQAVFTPDMKDVIWMSSRGSPTWYQTVVTAAQQTGFDPPMQNETFGPMFFQAISDPGFHTDLYELDLATGATRRLTHLNQIVPEFYFDPSGRQLLWSEGGHGRTIVGRMELAQLPRRAGAAVAVDRSWIGAPRRPVTSASNPAPPRAPSAPLPSVVVEGAPLLQAQLADLATRLQGLPQGPSCCRGPKG